MSTEVKNEETPKLTRKDFVPEAAPRWCPGCGDYAILYVFQRMLPDLGIKKEDFMVVSGIGCSSRFPYYMDTYGFHTLHGRAPTIATGIKAANPNLSLWMITGDGDGFSIGGNHMMHMLRKNPDINILLFNNRIYGLTKGQYSPTSESGKITKSSPQGSVEEPINPLSFAIASNSTFIARTLDTNPKHMMQTFKAAQAHKGVSFVEIFQNCVIFNDKIFEPVSGKEVRDDNLIQLTHGEPLVFGKEKDKGIVMEGLTPKIVEIKDGDTSGLTIHDEDADTSYAFALSKMEHPNFPTPIGVLLDQKSDAPTFEENIELQIKEAKEKKGHIDLQTLIKGNDFWVVDGDTETKQESSGASSTPAKEEMDIISEQKDADCRFQSDPIAFSFSTRIEEILEIYGSSHLETIDINTSVADTIKTFKDLDITTLPVVNGSELVGIVTAKDILFKCINKLVDKEQTAIKEIMSVQPISVPSYSTVAEALNAMSTHNIRHLLIQQDDGNIGMVSSRDILFFLEQNCEDE